MIVRLNTANNAALFSTVCAKYDEDIDYKVGRYIVDGKSLMGILSTRLNENAIVHIHTENTDIINDFLTDIKLWLVED